MIKLYTSAICTQCGPVKEALKEAGIEYALMSAEDDYNEMIADCERCEVDPKQIKSAPVMVVGDIIYDGADCLAAIEFGEVE